MTMNGGIRVQVATPREAAHAFDATMALLARLGLEPHVQACRESVVALPELGFALREQEARQWAPDSDTLGLCARLQLDTQGSADDLTREILLAMLLSPVPLRFPSHGELESAVRMRQAVVQAARRTAMNFDTAQAERPADDWTYADATGFILRPGRPLIPALQKATQPERAEQAYSFSCYRATEYLSLLAIAQEAQRVNPGLLQRLQAQWERSAIMSGRFHDVFLREHGSLELPLPIGYYIPGDRVWFRNPDGASADVAGYEGSWVFYLGGGLFPNFWCRDRPYTLLAKCVEIYHWRHGVCRDAEGEPCMDEDLVARRVAETMADRSVRQRVFERMFRLRDPRGVYAEGGCMDATRESPRWVRPQTSDIALCGA